MGNREAVRRKLDSLFGRKSKAEKLRVQLKQVKTRISVLRNHQRLSLDRSRSNVLQRLRQGHHDGAILGAGSIIKEQNMLDAFDIIESYCDILSQMAYLLDYQRKCPQELQEVISGLMYAESRCSQLSELHQFRKIIISWLGKDFVFSSVELQEPGVNSTIIQKLSTRQPSHEMKTRVAEDVAKEYGIFFRTRSASPDISATSLTGKKDFLSSKSTMEKYKDATDAALDAFALADYAAAAARETVMLCRSASQGHGRSCNHP